MDRVAIEIKLNQDRSWLLERLSAMPEEELYAPRTRSEHDPAKTWSFADHFIHTTLVESNWNDMFRRHLSGEPALPQAMRAGEGATRSDVMSRIHAWTEDWAERHRNKPFDELVRIGLAVRAETLSLLAQFSDDDLASVIPGAPWADHTVGGIMAANADHGRTHYKWAKDGDAS